MTEVRSECHGNTMEMELWAVLCKSILMETFHNAMSCEIIFVGVFSGIMVLFWSFWKRFYCAVAF